jgi:hypothetical protein
MRSLRFVGPVCLLSVMLSLVGCGYVEVIQNLEEDAPSRSQSVKVTGSGVLKSETRAVSGFSAIHLSGVGNVAVRQTGKESLKIEADDNILPLLTSKVVNGVLELSVEKGHNPQPKKPIRYTIEVKSLKGLSLSGAGNIEAESLQTSKLAVTASGAGNVKLKGRADDLAVTVSGAGNYEGEALQTRQAKVNISGAGNAVVRVSDSLDAKVTGVGSVEYLGSPQVRKSVTGVGSIRQR